jgi:putative RecB family exonuclease
MIAPLERPLAPPNPIPELVATVSASRLGCWLTCRLKFYFRYVLKLKQTNTAAQYVGSRVHGVLQHWNLARWRQQPHDVDTLKTVYEREWQEKQKQDPVRWEPDEETGEKATGWSLLDLYLKETPIPAGEPPVGVELKLAADLSRFGLPRLIGILDLVRQGGRIVDYKTAGQTPNAEKSAHLHELQLTSYSVLYRENTDSREKGLELHTLVKTKQPKLIVQELPPATEHMKTRLFRIMDSYQNGVEREDWVPSPSPMSCGGCDYFKACRKWN